MTTTDSAQRSGELARTKIIEVAFEHFARHGYRGSSLARIAADAEIPQSGLLHHFHRRCCSSRISAHAAGRADRIGQRGTAEDQPAVAEPRPASVYTCRVPFDRCNPAQSAVEQRFRA
ncbi:TetR/AcrR family transcriptional regulator, partial [Nocardia sp. NPDC004123]